MGDPGVIEAKALARLRQLGGEDLVRKMAGIFLEQVPQRLEDARAGLMEGDLRAVERAAHSMKSTAWNLGAAALGAVAARMERTAGNAQARELVALMAELEAAVSAAREALMRDVPGLADRKIIAVIEDNADNRVLVSAILEGRYETRGYSTGAEALEGMRREPPALVLLDVSLPVMDGTQVLGRIRKDAKLKHLPVIALTAHAMLGDREHFLDAGFDDYLAKPIVDPEHLVGAISRLLERGGRSESS